jgi:hypothetical protein
LQTGPIEVGSCASCDHYATDIQPITYEGPEENSVHRLPNERALYCIQLWLARNDTLFFNVFAGFFHYPMRRSKITGVSDALARAFLDVAGRAFSLVERVNRWMSQ